MKSFIVYFLVFCGHISIVCAQNFELQQTYTKEGGTVQALAFPNYDQYVLRGGNTNNSLQIWETETGKLMRNFTDFRHVFAVSYRPDGNRIASIGSENTLKIWDTQTAKVLQSFKEARATLRHLAYSPDGVYVMLVTDTEILLYAPQEEKVVKRLANKGNDGLFTKAVYSPDGLFIATASNLVVTLFNVATGEQTILNGHVGEILDIAYSPDNKHIAIISEDGAIKIWNVATRNIVKTMKEMWSDPKLLCYTTDGRQIAVAHKDNSLTRWDWTTDKQKGSIPAQDSPITALAYAPSGKYLAVGYENGAMKLWKDKRYFFQEDCELYVQKELEKWYEKDKFEKTEEFQTRLKTHKIEDKVKEWTQNYINETAQKLVDWKKATYEYDADSETYKIGIDEVAPIFVKVPVADAKLIDRQIQDARYKNVQFGVTEAGKVSILALDMELLVQREGKLEVKKYTYNSQDKTTFAVNELHLKYPPLPTIEIPTLPTPKNETPAKPTEKTTASIEADIDTQLPATKNKNPNAIAVIIGNAQYEKVKEVKYALRDAQVMKRYVIEVLGFKEENILYYENAKYTDFKIVFGEENNPKGKLYNMIKPDESDVFVFYSGHGAPSLNNKKGYFVPVDCDAQYLELAAYPIDVFYDNLSKVRAKSLTIAVDACFSGADIFQNISPIVIKPKGVAGVKAGALFSSSTDAQVSCWYNEKGHGMFTYFFLKAIHNKNADKNQDNNLTLREIQAFIADQSEGLPYYARRVHGIEQTPSLQGQALDRVWIEY